MTAASHPDLALKLMILGRRRPGTTLAEHRHHIRQVHGERVLGFVATAPALAPRRYVQNAVFDGSYRSTAPADDPLALGRDFVTEIWFPDLAAMARSRETDYYRQHLHGDEDNFVDQASVVFVPVQEQLQFDGPHAATAGVKLFGALQRRPDTDPAAFAAAFAAAWAGWPRTLRAFDDEVPLRHVRNQVLPRPGAALPLDVIDEFWLADEAHARRLLLHWQAWVQQALVQPGLVAAQTPFALLATEAVLHAGPA